MITVQLIMIAKSIIVVTETMVVQSTIVVQSTTVIQPATGLSRIPESEVCTHSKAKIVRALGRPHDFTSYN